jgi:nucleoside-diphosphate-sugar epimerase
MVKTSKKRRVVVTGGLGYIGYVLVEELLRKGDEVVVLDKLVFGQKVPAKLLRRPSFSFVKGDIRHIEDLMEALREADVVVHLASIVGDPSCELDYDETISTNVESTKLLLEIAKFRNVQRIIFASTASVYGTTRVIATEKRSTKPLSLYARTKLDSEKIILKSKKSDMETVVLRLATVYGWSERMRYDLVLNFMVARAFHEGKIEVYGGQQYRPLIHVRDAARAFMLVLDSSKKKVDGEIFNVGNEEDTVRIVDLAKSVKKRFTEAQLKVHRKEKDQRDYRLDFEKIRKSLGYYTKYDILYGVDEIRRMLKKGNVKDYKEDKYYNVKYLYKNTNL